MSGAQHSATLVRAKLDLSRSVCRQHFVKPEIQILIAKFIYQRRQVNRASIVYARLVRHCGEWSNFNFTPGKSFDVKPEQMLDRVESQTRAAAEQRFVTSARFQ